jgi:hypothetical protein
MIIVKLMGGLGNQMFQYAAGRRLAEMHNTELKLDLSFLSKRFEGCTPRNFELLDLNFTPVFANWYETAKLSGTSTNPPISWCLRLLQATGVVRPARNPYHEHLYHYDALFEQLSDNTYLEGYWQSEKYFTGIADVIRREFQVTTPLDERNRLLSQQIAASNSVSVHVRRGDYITNENAAQHHGTCSMDYYRKAVEMMASRTDQPTFFVFSDDPDWTRANMGFIPGAEFVASNGPDRGPEDLRLLSSCRHHIIANSSFSWWGAWLGSDLDKNVIAPARWYLRDDIDTGNLCPQGWNRI